MTAILAKMAHMHPCPMSRNFHDAKEECRGAMCPLWRWLPLECGPEFKAAMDAAREITGEKKPAQNKTLNLVMKERARFGLPTEPNRGYCGAGGPLEVRA